MTQEVTIEQMNEVIARFMGGESKTVNIGGVKTERFYMPNSHITDYVSDFSCLDYHSSWDSLMPVVQKIHGLAVVGDAINGTINNDIFRFSIFAPLQDVHLAVYNFIEWYNQQSGREAGGDDTTT